MSNTQDFYAARAAQFEARRSFVVAPGKQVTTKRGVLDAGAPISQVDVEAQIRLGYSGMTGARDQETQVPAWEVWRELLATGRVIENFSRATS